MSRSDIEKHGSGITAWFWRNSIWIAPVIALGITWCVVQWL